MYIRILLETTKVSEVIERFVFKYFYRSAVASYIEEGESLGNHGGKLVVEYNLVGYYYAAIRPPPVNSMKY